MTTRIRQPSFSPRLNAPYPNFPHNESFFVMSTLQHSEVVQRQLGVVGIQVEPKVGAWTMPERARMICAALACQFPYEMVELFPGRSRGAIKSYRARLVIEGVLPKLGKNRNRRIGKVSGEFVEAMRVGATIESLMVQFSRSASAIRQWKKKAGLLRPVTMRWDAEETTRLIAWSEGGARLLNLTIFPGRSAKAVSSRLCRLKVQGFLPTRARPSSAAAAFESVSF